jgi:hypothetical protein
MFCKMDAQDVDLALEIIAENPVTSLTTVTILIDKMIDVAQTNPLTAFILDRQIMRILKLCYLAFDSGEQFLEHYEQFLQENAACRTNRWWHMMSEMITDIHVPEVSLQQQQECDVDDDGQSDDNGNYDDDDVNRVQKEHMRREERSRSPSPESQ